MRVLLGVVASTVLFVAQEQEFHLVFDPDDGPVNWGLGWPAAFDSDALFHSAPGTFWFLLQREDGMYFTCRHTPEGHRWIEVEVTRDSLFHPVPAQVGEAEDGCIVRWPMGDGDGQLRIEQFGVKQKRQT